MLDQNAIDYLMQLLFLLVPVIILNERRCNDFSISDRVELSSAKQLLLPQLEVFKGARLQHTIINVTQQEFLGRLRLRVYVKCAITTDLHDTAEAFLDQRLVHLLELSEALVHDSFFIFFINEVTHSHGYRGKWYTHGLSI